MTEPASLPCGNQLLSDLPEDVHERVASRLEPVDLAAGQVISESSPELDGFYFVMSGVVSLLHTTRDGHSAEVALIGNEGALGLTLVLGRHPMPLDAVVQVPGRALRLQPQQLQREFARGGALQRNLLRYVQALMTQMAQTVVCNRHHTVSQQFCRWILLLLDRSPPGADVHMTQETIARMLGVRRAGVTEAASELQRAGLIEYSRGHIRVPDRSALEARGCECYWVIRAEYDRLRRNAAGRDARYA